MIEITIGIREVAIFLLGNFLGVLVGTFVSDLIWRRSHMGKK